MKAGGTVKFVANALIIVLLALGGYTFSHHLVRLTVVHGTSMYPTYKDGDLLISAPQAKYRVGDVITYHPADLPCDLCNVVHRIIRGDENGWITQGDNNPNIDAWKPTASQISGTVILHVSMPALAKIAYHPSLWFMLLFGCISLWFYRRWLADKDAEEGPKHRAEPLVAAGGIHQHDHEQRHPKQA